MCMSTASITLTVSLLLLLLLLLLLPLPFQRIRFGTHGTSTRPLELGVMALVVLMLLSAGSAFVGGPQTFINPRLRTAVAPSPPPTSPIARAVGFGACGGGVVSNMNVHEDTRAPTAMHGAPAAAAAWHGRSDRTRLGGAVKRSAERHQSDCPKTVGVGVDVRRTACGRRIRLRSMGMTAAGAPLPSGSGSGSLESSSWASTRAARVSSTAHKQPRTYAADRCGVMMLALACFPGECGLQTKAQQR